MTIRLTSLVLQIGKTRVVTTKHSYRMIACDLDGTLLLPDGSITARTVTALRRAAAAGYLVAIATGRNYTESRAIVQRIGDLHDCVFVGGAMVIDTSSGKTLHRTVMHSELAADICRMFESHGHAALALQDTCETGLDYLITGSIPIATGTRNWLRTLKMEVKYQPSLGDYDHRHTLRVGICGTAEQVAGVMPVVQRHYGDRTMMHSLHVPGMDCEVLEVFDPAVNKWEGVQFIARRHHIEPGQIIAMGDDHNDIPMIKNCGLGLAMSNARPALKAVAGRIIGRNTEDGVAVFLEQLLEGKSE